MIKRPTVDTYNDGVLYVCDPDSARSEFGAKITAKSEDELTKRYKLNFSEMSARDSDLQFAEASGRTLTRKVRTRLRQDIGSTDQILIGGTLYSIIKLDIDRHRAVMFFYLEEAREL